MKHVTYFILLSLLVSLPAEAKSLVVTGGSCASQGAWTARAIEQSNAIVTTAQQLANDPDCGVLSKAILAASAATNPPASSAQADAVAAGPGSTYETLPADLMALRSVLQQNPDNKALVERLTPALAKSTMDIATNNASISGGPLNLDDLTGVKERMKRTVSMGEAMLQAMFTTFPQQQRCLQKNNESSLALITASVRMMGAFASANETSGQNLAALMTQFTSFLRQMRAAKIVSEADLAQFWSEMSCLVETTQQSYCNAKDGLELLNFQAQEAKIFSDIKAKVRSGQVSKDSAIEGYVLLGNEGVAISEWLQKVQSGVEPKTTSDATFKQSVRDTVNTLINTIDRVQGYYNQNFSVYQSLSTVQEKQQNIRDFISGVSGMLIDQRVSVNFFTQSSGGNLGLPFFLVGRDFNNLPDEVLGKGTSGRNAMSADQFFQDSARFAEINSPDKLMATIHERLGDVSQRALQAGSVYFSKNLTVDGVNLVDQSITGTSATVFESLQHVRDYIARLAKKYAETGGGSSSITLSMTDTLARLDRVLDKFNQLNNLASTYNLLVRKGVIDLKNFRSLDASSRAAVTKMYQDLITSVYEEFDILLHKESFISDRLSTYVRYDLNQRIRTHEDMSPYVQYLLIYSGKSMMYRMQDFNDTALEADLSEAQRINMKNLDEVEELFAGDMWNYINSLAKSTGNSYVKRPTDNPFSPWYSAITDFPAITWDMLTHLPGHSGKIASQDDDNVLAFLRGKVCTQTLAFKQWSKFAEVCRGSVLESRMTSSVPADLHLKFNYDDLAAESSTSVWDRVKLTFGGEPPTGKRYQHVCTLRDFYRNNQVYWLTIDQGPPLPVGPGPAKTDAAPKADSPF